MKRQLMTCLAASTLCGLSAHAGAEGFATWNANSGGFSYSIFNLSGQSCNLTAWGATKNPDAYTYGSPNALGWIEGWNGSYQSVAFFNTYNNHTDMSDSVVFYVSDSPMQQIYSISGEANDPTSWVAKSPSNYPYTPINPLANGQLLRVVEPTIQMGSQPNPAAAGDSWSICCEGDCNGENHNIIVMANLASAGDSLGSGLLYDAYDYFAPNSALNPPAVGNWGPFSSSNPPSANVNGQGFVTSEDMVFNLNQNPADANYVGTGGLWLGIENPNTQGPKPQAVYSLVPSMFPVNLASYTQAQQENNNGHTQYQSYIYGAHLTFAIGDPFLISSFAAKTLWYLATSPNYLSDNTFTDPNKINLVPPAGQLFPSGYASDYINSLLNSTAQAGYAVSEAINSASQANEKESFWGKVFSALFNVTMTAIDVGAAVATGGASDVAQVGIQTAVNTATGALGSPVDNAINNAFTSNTTMGPPATQTAPLAYNSTFASSNLLGLMLTNFVVQYQVNAFTGNINNNPNPLWSNAAMFSETPTNAQGNCTNLGVTGNLFQTNVECYDTFTFSYVKQSGLATTPTYTNVCETVDSNSICTNDGMSETQLNIWDAVMTGSTVGADSNGMLVLQNPATWSFQPPTLIGEQSVASISTNFNLNTGALSLTEYVESSPVPQTQPIIVGTTVGYGGGKCDTLTYTPGTVSYDATTGMLSTTDWQSGCEAEPKFNYGDSGDLGGASLNMATCQENSQVVFNVSSTGDAVSGPTSVWLSCEYPNLLNQAGVVLNYNKCVSDPNATGGVVAMNIGSGPALACVCMPSYLINGNPQTTTNFGYYATDSRTQGNPCVVSD